MRLAALVDPAIDRLTKLLKAKHGPVALGAVKDVLDRNGLQAKNQAPIEGDITFTLSFDRKKKPDGDDGA